MTLCRYIYVLTLFHVRAYTYSHTHKPGCLRMHAHTNTYILERCSEASMISSTYIHILTLFLVRAYTYLHYFLYVLTHTHTHTYLPYFIYMHKHIHIRTNQNACGMYIHTHVYAYTYSHTHKPGCLRNGSETNIYAMRPFCMRRLYHTVSSQVYHNVCVYACTHACVVYVYLEEST
jgi:hypothetical protein